MKGWDRAQQLRRTMRRVVWQQRFSNPRQGPDEQAQATTARAAPRSPGQLNHCDRLLRGVEIAKVDGARRPERSIHAAEPRNNILLRPAAGDDGIRFCVRVEVAADDSAELSIRDGDVGVSAQFKGGIGFGG